MEKLTFYMFEKLGVFIFTESSQEISLYLFTIAEKKDFRANFRLRSKFSTSIFTQESTKSSKIICSKIFKIGIFNSFVTLIF